jgi:hypothetical protein
MRRPLILIPSESDVHTDTYCFFVFLFISTDASCMWKDDVWCTE